MEATTTEGEREATSAEDTSVFSLDVIMPYHGDPELLMRAVASVRALIGVNWRLTIVEDAHRDGETTEKRISELGDDRICYLRNETNLGVAGNTYRCLQMAELEYFVLMDYDDMMLPNYGLAVASLFRRHPEAVIAQPGIQIIDENDRPYLPLPDRVKAHAGPVNTDTELSGEAAVASVLRGNWTYGPSLCYRLGPTRALRPRPDTDAVHDMARIVDLLCQGGSLAVGAEVAFQYRRHRTSHSSVGAREGARFQQEQRYFELMSAELAKTGWKQASRAASMRLYSRLNAAAQLVSAARRRDRALIKALLWHAIR